MHSETEYLDGSCTRKSESDALSNFFLGVDTGSTKSHALIADDAGRALGLGTSGPGNPDVIGYGALTNVLHDAVHQALSLAGITKEHIAGAGFGIGGYDWPSQREPILAALLHLELSAPLEIVNDAIIGLLAGAAAGWGVAIVAGTSCNCWGWDQQRRTGRMTGFGTSMAEGAGASELVGKAVQAVALEWTQRGPPTRLTQAFMELAGACSAEDLLECITLRRFRVPPSAAPIVFQVAADGDAVSGDLVRWAGRELGSMAIGVIRQLGFEPLTFDVVLAGSFFNGGPLLIDAISETIHVVAPGAHLVHLHAPPVVGGTLLGMEQAGVDITQVRQALVNSTQKLLSTKEYLTKLPRAGVT